MADRVGDSGLCAATSSDRMHALEQLLSYGSGDSEDDEVSASGARVGHHHDGGLLRLRRRREERDREGRASLSTAAFLSFSSRSRSSCAAFGCSRSFTRASSASLSARPPPPSFPSCCASRRSPRAETLGLKAASGERKAVVFGRGLQTSGRLPSTRLQSPSQSKGVLRLCLFVRSESPSRKSVSELSERSGVIRCASCTCVALTAYARVRFRLCIKYHLDLRQRVNESSGVAAPRAPQQRETAPAVAVGERRRPWSACNQAAHDAHASHTRRRDESSSKPARTIRGAGRDKAVIVFHT